MQVGAPREVPVYSRAVPVAELASLVRDLAVVRHGPGLLQVAVRGLVMLGLAAVVARGAVLREPWVFGGGLVVLAFWVASAMILTHDAIHRTLTGIRWLDDGLPPLLSWPLLWPHLTYGRLHLLHHKWNGTDIRDPERIEPLPHERAAAGRLGRWRMKHRFWIRVFFDGGVGLIVEMARHGYKLRDEDPRMRRALVLDLVGLVFTQGMLYGGAWWTGEHVLGGRGGEMALAWGLVWLVLERFVGAIMQFRGQIEHDGLWGSGPTFFDTQWAGCRNVATHPLVARYFNYLNFHSIHHAFAFVPWYALEEGHRRIAGRLAEAGFQDVPEDGYVGAACLVTRIGLLEVPTA
ncbi:MAG: fatty acid desaturase [Candidatus Sericytochromatia bacterium]|nr:fatty acid desaturase [Candidatus Tanganyikabacteria bacterium]